MSYLISQLKTYIQRELPSLGYPIATAIFVEQLDLCISIRRAKIFNSAHFSKIYLSFFASATTFLMCDKIGR